MILIQLFEVMFGLQGRLPKSFYIKIRSILFPSSQELNLWGVSKATLGGIPIGFYVEWLIPVHTGTLSIQIVRISWVCRLFTIIQSDFLFGG